MIDLGVVAALGHSRLVTKGSEEIALLDTIQRSLFRLRRNGNGSGQSMPHTVDDLRFTTDSVSGVDPPD